MKLGKLMKETTHLQPRSVAMADKGSNGFHDRDKTIAKLIMMYGSLEAGARIFEDQWRVMLDAPPDQWPDPKWKQRADGVIDRLAEVMDPEREWLISQGYRRGYASYGVNKATQCEKGSEGWRKSQAAGLSWEWRY